METKKKSFAYGWSLVVCWFLSWGIFNFINAVAPSLFRTIVAAKYGYDVTPALDMSTWAGIVVSVLFLLLPKLMNKIGIKKTILIGGVGGGVTFLLIPYASNAYLLGFLIALGSLWGGLYCNITTVALVGRWFPRRKGIVMGVMTASGIFASSILLPTYNTMYNNLGLETTFLIFGVAMVIFFVLCGLWTKESPEEAGLDPDGMPMSAEERQALGATRQVRAEWTYPQMIRQKRFLLFSFGWVFEMTAIAGFSACYLNYLMEIGLDQNTVVAYASVVGIFQCVFSVASGALDTKIGVIKASLVLFVIQVICYFSMGLLGGTLAVSVIIFLWLVAMGTSGCPNNLEPSQGMSILGTTNYSSVHVLISLINSLRLIGNWIVARSLSWTGGYKAAVVVFGVLCIIAAVMTTAAGTKHLVSPVEQAEIDAAKAKA